MRASKPGPQPQLPPNAQPPMPPGPPRQKQANPPHVQQQYLVVPGQPGQIPPQIAKGQALPVGDNQIALPTPNYQYSNIGPNNQSLLSAGTLHHKLRVIEKINETPQ